MALVGADALAYAGAVEALATRAVVCLPIPRYLPPPPGRVRRASEIVLVLLRMMKSAVPPLAAGLVGLEASGAASSLSPLRCGLPVSREHKVSAINPVASRANDAWEALSGVDDRLLRQRLSGVISELLETAAAGAREGVALEFDAWVARVAALRLGVFVLQKRFWEVRENDADGALQWAICAAGQLATFLAPETGALGADAAPASSAALVDALYNDRSASEEAKAVVRGQSRGGRLAGDADLDLDREGEGEGTTGASDGGRGSDDEDAGREGDARHRRQSAAAPDFAARLELSPMAVGCSSPRALADGRLAASSGLRPPSPAHADTPRPCGKTASLRCRTRISPLLKGRDAAELESTPPAVREAAGAQMVKFATPCRDSLARSFGAEDAARERASEAARRSLAVLRSVLLRPLLQHLMGTASEVAHTPQVRAAALRSLGAVLRGGLPSSSHEAREIWGALQNALKPTEGHSVRTSALAVIGASLGGNALASESLDNLRRVVDGASLGGLQVIELRALCRAVADDGGDDLAARLLLELGEARLRGAGARAAMDVSSQQEIVRSLRDAWLGVCKADDAGLASGFADGDARTGDGEDEADSCGGLARARCATRRVRPDRFARALAVLLRKAPLQPPKAVLAGLRAVAADETCAAAGRTLAEGLLDAALDGAALEGCGTSDASGEAKAPAATLDDEQRGALLALWALAVALPGVPGLQVPARLAEWVVDSGRDVGDPDVRIALSTAAVVLEARRRVALAPGGVDPSFAAGAGACARAALVALEVTKGPTQELTAHRAGAQAAARVLAVAERATPLDALTIDPTGARKGGRKWGKSGLSGRGDTPSGTCARLGQRSADPTDWRAIVALEALFRFCRLAPWAKGVASSLEMAVGRGEGVPRAEAAEEAAGRVEEMRGEAKKRQGAGAQRTAPNDAGATLSRDRAGAASLDAFSSLPPTCRAARTLALGSLAAGDVASYCPPDASTASSEVSSAGLALRNALEARLDACLRSIRAAIHPGAPAVECLAGLSVLWDLLQADAVAQRRIESRDRLGRERSYRSASTSSPRPSSSSSGSLARSFATSTSSFGGALPPSPLGPAGASTAPSPLSKTSGSSASAAGSPSPLQPRSALSLTSGGSASEPERSWSSAASAPPSSARGKSAAMSMTPGTRFLRRIWTHLPPLVGLPGAVDGLPAATGQPSSPPLPVAVATDPTVGTLLVRILATVAKSGMLSAWLPSPSLFALCTLRTSAGAAAALALDSLSVSHPAVAGRSWLLQGVEGVARLRAADPPRAGSSAEAALARPRGLDLLQRSFAGPRAEELRHLRRCALDVACAPLVLLAGSDDVGDAAPASPQATRRLPSRELVAMSCLLVDWLHDWRTKARTREDVLLSNKAAQHLSLVLPLLHEYAQKTIEGAREEAQRKEQEREEEQKRRLEAEAQAKAAKKAKRARAPRAAEAATKTPTAGGDENSETPGGDGSRPGSDASEPRGRSTSRKVSGPTSRSDASLSSLPSVGAPPSSSTEAVAALTPRVTRARAREAGPPSTRTRSATGGSGGSATPRARTPSGRGGGSATSRARTPSGRSCSATPRAQTPSGQRSRRTSATGRGRSGESALKKASSGACSASQDASTPGSSKARSRGDTEMTGLSSTSHPQEVKMEDARIGGLLPGAGIGGSNGSEASTAVAVAAPRTLDTAAGAVKTDLERCKGEANRDALSASVSCVSKPPPAASLASTDRRSLALFASAHVLALLGRLANRPSVTSAWERLHCGKALSDADVAALFLRLDALVPISAAEGVIPAARRKRAATPTAGAKTPKTTPVTGRKTKRSACDQEEDDGAARSGASAACSESLANGPRRRACTKRRISMSEVRRCRVDEGREGASRRAHFERTHAGDFRRGGDAMLKSRAPCWELSSALA